jgi:phage/plasmid-like protein (TIGR03299 family)
MQSSMVCVNGVNNAELALKKSKLDWTVSKQDLTTATGATCATKQALVRDDTNEIIGIVSKKYRPFQNVEAFGFFDYLCDKYNASYEYGICIGDGSVVMLQTKMIKTCKIRDNDILQSYVTLKNSFDTTHQMSAVFTPVRLNGMSECVSEIEGIPNKITIRHTVSAMDKIAEANKVFDMNQKYFDHFCVFAKNLNQKLINDNIVEEYLNNLFGPNHETLGKKRHNMKKLIKDIYKYGKGNQGRSAWDLYCAVMEYIDHRSTSGKKRIASKFKGDGYRKKRKAWDLILKL